MKYCKLLLIENDDEIMKQNEWWRIKIEGQRRMERQGMKMWKTTMKDDKRLRKMMEDHKR